MDGRAGVLLSSGQRRQGAPSGRPFLWRLMTRYDTFMTTYDTSGP
jgi:hypothetical protein